MVGSPTFSNNLEEIDMQAIKSLLAVSVLAVAGAANAATHNFSYTETGTIAGLGPLSGILTGSINGTGTAVLDDVAGTLTLTGTSVATSNLGGTQNLTQTVVFSGTFAGGVFTATSGTNTPTACTGSCGYVQTNVAAPFTTAGGSLPLAGGTLNTTMQAAGSSVSTEQWAFVNTTPTPEVPVPAAAWLFGSGLFALAGTARRRRS